MTSTPGAFGDKSAADSAADKEAQRLVFDLLARGETDQHAIRRALHNAGHHPGAWALLRDEWAEHLAVREVPSAWRKVYRLKVTG